MEFLLLLIENYNSSIDINNPEFDLILENKSWRIWGIWRDLYRCGDSWKFLQTLYDMTYVNRGNYGKSTAMKAI